jgi:hypothetical protein
MRPLKRQDEAHEKGDEEDDGKGVITHQHHLVKSVLPLRLFRLKGATKVQ